MASSRHPTGGGKKIPPSGQSQQQHPGNNRAPPPVGRVFKMEQPTTNGGGIQLDEDSRDGEGFDLLQFSEKVPVFLLKLWRIVNDETLKEIVDWDESGYSFRIADSYTFSKNVLPQYFKHSNMNSLVRQLNMYGFRKLTALERSSLVRLESDQDCLEFSHPYFVRDHPELLPQIKRKTTSSTAANTNIQDGGVTNRTVSAVLEEVRTLRERQFTMDSRLQHMMKENQALWREVAQMRSLHMKQQQVVNKLIQFLISVVQPANQRRLSRRNLLSILPNEVVSAVAGTSAEMSGSYTTEPRESGPSGDLQSSDGAGGIHLKVPQNSNFSRRLQMDRRASETLSQLQKELEQPQSVGSDTSGTPTNIQQQRSPSDCTTTAGGMVITDVTDEPDPSIAGYFIKHEQTPARRSLFLKRPKEDQLVTSLQSSGGGTQPAMTTSYVAHTPGSAGNQSHDSPMMHQQMSPGPVNQQQQHVVLHQSNPQQQQQQQHLQQYQPQQQQPQMQQLQPQQQYNNNYADSLTLSEHYPTSTASQQDPSSTATDLLFTTAGLNPSVGLTDPIALDELVDSWHHQLQSNNNGLGSGNMPSLNLSSLSACPSGAELQDFLNGVDLSLDHLRDDLNKQDMSSDTLNDLFNDMAAADAAAQSKNANNASSSTVEPDKPISAQMQSDTDDYLDVVNAMVEVMDEQVDHKQLSDQTHGQASRKRGAPVNRTVAIYNGPTANAPKPGAVLQSPQPNFTTSPMMTPVMSQQQVTFPNLNQAHPSSGQPPMKKRAM